MPRDAHPSRRWEWAENGLYRVVERNIDTLRPGSDQGGGGEATKAELYDEAQALDVEGRSGMDKQELREAVRDKRGS